MARWWQARPRRATYSVIGCVTDDGSTFCVAVTMAGDVRAQLVDRRPHPGAVLYVVDNATDREHAEEAAITDYERRAAEYVWERGEVRYV